MDPLWDPYGLPTDPVDRRPACHPFESPSNLLRIPFESPSSPLRVPVFVEPSSSSSSSSPPCTSTSTFTATSTITPTATTTITTTSTSTTSTSTSSSITTTSSNPSSSNTTRLRALSRLLLAQEIEHTATADVSLNDEEEDAMAATCPTDGQLQMAHDVRARAAAAEQLVRAGDEGCGLDIRPRKGTMLLFFSRLDDGRVDELSWHGGAAVFDTDGSIPYTTQAGLYHPLSKWTVQKFSEVPECVRADPHRMAAFIRQCRHHVLSQCSPQIPSIEDFPMDPSGPPLDSPLDSPLDPLKGKSD
jgi:hypothetical protein